MNKPTEAAAFAAFRHGSFRWFTVAGMLWMAGDFIEHVISYWVIFEKFDTPMLGGYAVISHWAPFLLLGVYTGALADRFDCRKICLVSMLMFAGVSLAWAYLFLTGTTEVWHAVVLLTLHGLAGAIFMPASQLVIHEMVGNERLQSAIRLTATSRQLGMLLGPAVGGVLLLVLGPGLGMIVNALLYLPLIWWALTQPYTGHAHREAGAPTPLRLGLGSAVRVMRDAAGNRVIMSMIVLAGVTSLLVGNAYQAQMPEFAAGFLTGNAGVIYTLLLVANAAGAVFGGILLESVAAFRPRPRTAVALAAAWSVCIVVFAAAPHYLIALAALFVAGVLQIGFSSMSMTLVQLEAPARQRGQIIGVYSMSFNGLRMGSGISVGFLGAVVGVHWSLGLSAVALLTITAALFFYARAPHQPMPAGRPMSISPDHFHNNGCGCC